MNRYIHKMVTGDYLDEIIASDSKFNHEPLRRLDYFFIEPDICDTTFVCLYLKRVAWLFEKCVDIMVL